MNNFISVIMSVYKESKQDVVVSVESILAQTYTNWEIIIVLDWPENFEVKEYLIKLSNSYQNIHFIENSINLGLAASLNKAVKFSKGDYCARMDTEDRSYPTRFEKQIAYFEKNSHVDLLFCQWEELHENGKVKKQTPSSKEVQNIVKNFFIKSILLHPTLMLRREVLRQYNYPTMGRPEDWVLFLKLIRLGYKFDIVEEILFEYKVDNQKKFAKTKTYTNNLLPHLIRNIPFYWSNVFFWFYVFRVAGEFVITRNKHIYGVTAPLSSLIWKKIFKPN